MEGVDITPILQKFKKLSRQKHVQNFCEWLWDESFGFIQFFSLGGHKCSRLTLGWAILVGELDNSKLAILKLKFYTRSQKIYYIRNLPSVTALHSGQLTNLTLSVSTTVISVIKKARITTYATNHYITHLVKDRSNWLIQKKVSLTDVCSESTQNRACVEVQPKESVWGLHDEILLPGTHSSSTRALQ